MRLVTWNVNSLNARQERVEEWLSEVEPDVVCMQETKLANDAFPYLSLPGARIRGCAPRRGSLERGRRSCPASGSTTSSPTSPMAVRRRSEARIVSATCGGVRVASVYVPNGRSLDHEQYQYKLSWLGRVCEHLDAAAAPATIVVVAGDFNIAPDRRRRLRPGEVRRRDPCEPARARCADGDRGARAARRVPRARVGSRRVTRGGTTEPVTSTRDGACASISCWPRRRWPIGSSG